MEWWQGLAFGAIVVAVMVIADYRRNTSFSDYLKRKRHK